jgi:hypothetical protein
VDGCAVDFITNTPALDDKIQFQVAVEDEERKLYPNPTDDPEKWDFELLKCVDTCEDAIGRSKDEMTNRNM